MSRLYNNVLKGATAEANAAEKRPTIKRKPPPLSYAGAMAKKKRQLNKERDERIIKNREKNKKRGVYDI